MIFTILIVLLSLLFFWDYSRKKKRNEISASIPGPMQIPIFGALFIFQVRNAKDSTQLTIDNAKLYKGFSRAWIFNKLSILMTRPKDLEIVLSSTKHIQKSSLYKIVEIWLGGGLLTSTGSKWHARRKVITPAFHFKILEQFVEIFDQQSGILVEQLEKYADGKTAFNVYPVITLAALDVICETAMGVKINSQTDTNNKYAQAVCEISAIMMHKIANVFYQSELIFKIFAPKEKARQDGALAVLHGFTEKVIQQRRQTLEKEKLKKATNENRDEDIGVKRKMALLDILLQSSIDGKPLSDEDIREEVDTFMFEGHDTTTSGTSYALYNISRHPHVQNKILDEIHEIIGDDREKPVTYTDLQAMKYMECVIKESLRMFPAVPVLGRETTEDVKIDEHTIPAGSELIIPVFVMMKDPEIFPDPETFNPERHALDSMEKMHPYAFLPFSAGPRNCIGQKFAMLEMKSTITKILRYYELLPLGEDPDPIINLVMKSTNGINIGIKRRFS